MLKSYLRHLYRDRRRFILSATLILISTFIASDSLPDPMPYIRTEGLVIFGIFFAMPLVAIYARKHRYLIEVMALANFAFAITGWVLPSSAANLAAENASYTAGGVIYLATLVGAYYLLYGKWSDNFTPSRTFVVRTLMRSTADLRTLWYGLIAFPGHLDHYPHPEVVSVDFVDPAHRVIRMVNWEPNARRGEWLVFVDEMEKFRHAKLRMRIVEGVYDAAAIGTTEFWFRDHGAFRTVTMQFDANAVAPRRMLRHWLDDTVGRMMDSRIAAIEHRAAHPGSPRISISYDEWWEDTTEVTAKRRDTQSGFRTAHGRDLTSAEINALAPTKPVAAANAVPPRRGRKKAA